MSEKLCVFCKHMDTDSWGSESMGEFEDFVCNRGHFAYPVSIRFLRANILRAETCEDYEPDK